MNGSIYVNRESGALVKIGPVDDHHAQQVVLTGPAAGGSYKIPLAEYDSTFVTFFRPAGPDDLVSLDDPTARGPRNATPEWLEEGDPGQRTLASAIARLERRLEGVAAADQAIGEGPPNVVAARVAGYASGLEDALAELRA